MTINIRGPNSHINHHPPDLPLPPHRDSAMFDPTSIEAMANQLYAALPVDSDETGPVNRTQPPAEAAQRLPQADSNGAIAGISAPSPATPAPPGGEDDFSLMAKQLYAQMQPTNLDPSLQQAFAGLQPATPAPATPAPATISSEQLNDAALKEMAKQLYADIPAIYPTEVPGASIATPPRPTSAVPLSDTDVRSSVPPDKPEPIFYFLSPPAVKPLRLESGEPFDVIAIRKDFPILHQKINGKPLIWLDNAATTQKPQSVIDALSHYYQKDNSNIHRAAHTLAARATDAYEGAREKVQRFLGAGSASEIIFVRGTTEAINLVAQTYGRKYIGEGDEIVLSNLEHHANIVPWQMLAKETGAVLKVVPVSDRGEVLLEEYARLLGPRTRLVGLTQVSNALGTILPVREMTEIAHRHGAKVLIDGAQAVSHMPVNVQDIGCDFYTLSGHKLFAPTGIGVLYAKREILEDMPPWQGGGSMIRHVTFERTIYSDPPAKFEAGTPNIADAVGLGAAIDYITRLGMVNIEQYEHKLTEYAIERLSAIPGLRLIGTAPHKVSVVSFVLEDMPVEQVGQRLAREGIAVRAGHHCAQPTMQRFGLTGTVRPSLAFYNTCGEVDTLVDVVRSLRFS